MLLLGFLSQLIYMITWLYSCTSIFTWNTRFFPHFYFLSEIFTSFFHHRPQWLWSSLLRCFTSAATPLHAYTPPKVDIHAYNLLLMLQAYSPLAYITLPLTSSLTEFLTIFDLHIILSCTLYSFLFFLKVNLPSFLGIYTWSWTSAFTTDRPLSWPLTRSMRVAILLH